MRSRRRRRVLVQADMARRQRSPQEKKRLSLARDNLSTTGEAPHGLRNHWKKKKRSVERARRTAERVALEVGYRFEI